MNFNKSFQHIHINLLLVCLLLPLVGTSQNSNEAKEISKTYLIENVFVKPSPSQAQVFTSLLIENGLIKEIGPNIRPPYNAQIIDADSMHVYAGFIDMASHTAIDMPKKDEDRPEILDPNFPPNDYVGITPQKKASALIATNNSAIKDMRAAGFTTSHILPKGDFLPGSGAVILLSGKSKEEILLNDNASKYLLFSTANRSFPATKIGIMAKWRELYHQASNAKKHKASYASNNNLKRPSYSDAVVSLQDVTSNKQPVYFKTEKVLDIHRALQLKKELGFNMVLTDVQQVLPAIDIIKKSNVSVVLAMHLPKDEEREKKKAEKEKAEKKKKEAKKDGEEKKEEKPKKKKKEKKLDLEKEQLTKRRQQAIDDYVAQAANLSKASIPFGFSFIKGKPKNTHDFLLRMIEKGLTEKDALSALTTTPAKLLGLQKVLGTVEKGKIANLVISDKPYFQEKSKIKYVFVDGIPFKMEKEKKKKKAEGESDAIVGKWDYSTDIPMPNNTGIMIIKRNKDNFDISIASADDLEDFEEITDVALDDDNLVFDFDIDNDGTSMKISIDLTFDGESFEGTLIAGQFGTFNMTGDRTSNNPDNH